MSIKHYLAYVFVLLGISQFNWYLNAIFVQRGMLKAVCAICLHLDTK